MSFLPHKKFTWADFGGYIPISPRRYAPDHFQTVTRGAILLIRTPDLRRWRESIGTGKRRVGEDARKERSEGGKGEGRSGGEQWRIQDLQKGWEADHGERAEPKRGSGAHTGVQGQSTPKAESFLSSFIQKVAKN